MVWTASTGSLVIARVTGTRYQYVIHLNLWDYQGGTGNLVLPQYVKNSLSVLCTELAVYFLISCEILVVHSPAKFAYFLKSKRNYHFVTANLSSGNALKIQGQYEHCIQYRARDCTLPGSIKLREFEWKVLKRPQNEEKTHTPVYDFFLRSFANFAFLSENVIRGRF